MSHKLPDGTVLTSQQTAEQVDSIVANDAESLAYFVDQYGPIDKCGIPQGMRKGVMLHLAMVWRDTKDHFLFARECGEYKEWGDTDFDIATVFLSEVMLDLEAAPWPDSAICWMDVIELVYILQHSLEDLIKLTIYPDFVQKAN